MVKNSSFLALLREAPYLLFFGLGSLVALYTLTLWPLFAFGGKVAYPGLLHQQAIISLFLGSFIAGVLFTALPRFTRAKFNTAGWIQWTALFSLLELVGWLFFSSLGLLAMLIKFALLYGFVKNCLHRAQSPLPTACWLHAGFVSVLSGCILFTWKAFLPATFPNGLGRFAQVLFTQGFPLAVVTGVGIRLVPAFAGLTLLRPDESAGQVNTHQFWHIALSTLFFVGLALEARFNLQIGMAVITMALAGEMVGFWRIYQKPAQHVRGRMLWLSAWAILLGCTATMIFPNLSTHLLHLPLIAGVVGITLVIGAQVLTSHEGLNTEKMIRFNPLGWIWLLVLAAAATRLSAAFVSYEPHLGYAGGTLAAAIIWWFFAYPWQAIKKRLHSSALAENSQINNATCCPPAKNC
jgi:hypothetical protein